MKKYLKEIIILIIQLLTFYILPLFAGPADTMGLIVLMILITFNISLLLGILSNDKIKYLYSLLIAILFIPSVYIYYNDSALIHSLWYFVISLVAIVIGSIIKKFVLKINKK